MVALYFNSNKTIQGVEKESIQEEVLYSFPCSWLGLGLFLPSLGFWWQRERGRRASGRARSLRDSLLYLILPGITPLRFRARRRLLLFPTRLLSSISRPGRGQLSLRGQASQSPPFLMPRQSMVQRHGSLGLVQRRRCCHLGHDNALLVKKKQTLILHPTFPTILTELK